MPKKTTPAFTLPDISAQTIDAYLKAASEPIVYATADNAVDKYVAAAGDRELPAVIADVLALRERHLSLPAPERPAAADTGDAVRALVRGELTADQAAERAAEADRARLAADAAETMHQRAAAVCRIGQVRRVKDATEDAVLPPLRDALAEALAEARETAPAAAGIADDAGALRAAPEAREAWLRLAELRVRVVAAVNAAGAMRQYTGSTHQNAPGTGQVDSDSSRYGELSSWIMLDRNIRNAVVGAGVGAMLVGNRAPGAEVRSFANAVAADVVIDIFTAEEAKANYLRECREERAAEEEEEKRGHRPQRAPNTWI